MRSPRQASPRHAARTRDAAIDRVRRVRLWLITGATALAAAFSGLAAALAPGRTVQTTASVSSSSSSGQSSSGGQSSSDGQTSFDAPSPVVSSDGGGGATVVSGSS